MGKLVFDNLSKVDIWLANQFQGGNSARKVEKIEAARFAV